MSWQGQHLFPAKLLQILAELFMFWKNLCASVIQILLSLLCLGTIKTIHNENGRILSLTACQTGKEVHSSSPSLHHSPHSTVLAHIV